MVIAQVMVLPMATVKLLAIFPIGLSAFVNLGAPSLDDFDGLDWFHGLWDNEHASLMAFSPLLTPLNPVDRRAIESPHPEDQAPYVPAHTSNFHVRSKIRRAHVQATDAISKVKVRPMLCQDGGGTAIGIQPLQQMSSRNMGIVALDQFITISTHHSQSSIVEIMVNQSSQSSLRSNYPSSQSSLIAGCKTLNDLEPLEPHGTDSIAMTRPGPCSSGWLLQIVDDWLMANS